MTNKYHDDANAGPGTVAEGSQPSGFFRGLARKCPANAYVSLLTALFVSLSIAPARAEEAAAEESTETEPAAESAAEPEPPAPPPKGKQPVVNARLRLEYQHRELGSEKDTDFYGRLYSGARDLYDGRLDLYISGRLHTDFDETTTTSLADDPFVSIEDTSSVTEDRLLQAYADLHTQTRRLALRAGRQYVEVADYLQLDGGQFMVNENGPIGGRIYLGHPVSYYTSVSDDYAVGASVIGRPFAGNQSRLTFSRYSDDSEDGADNNYYLDVRQTVSETLRARGQLSMLNDEYRMAQADMFYLSEDGETDFSAGGSYWGSFDANTRVYSPLYRVLGEMDPYTYLYSRLTQQIAPQWLLSPGISIKLADDSDNPQNNRDYENYDLTLIYQPNKTFNASLAAEYWVVDQSDSFTGLSGELRYRKGRLWEASGGAHYAQYTYDTYSDFSYVSSGGRTVFSETGAVVEESPYVKTYFVRGKLRMTKWLTGRAQFDVEDDDTVDDLSYRARVSIEVRY